MVFICPQKHPKTTSCLWKFVSERAYAKKRLSNTNTIAALTCLRFRDTWWTVRYINPSFGLLPVSLLSPLSLLKIQNRPGRVLCLLPLASLICGNSPDMRRTFPETAMRSLQICLSAPLSQRHSGAQMLSRLCSFKQYFLMRILGRVKKIEDWS